VTVGEEAFWCCTSLEDFHVSKDNALYSDIDGVLYRTVLIKYPQGRKGCLDIPEGVKKIKDSTFAGCSSLTFVSIPDGVIKIGIHWL
jgi:hypothetical protein